MKFSFEAPQQDIPDNEHESTQIPAFDAGEMISDKPLVRYHYLLEKLGDARDGVEKEQILKDIENVVAEMDNKKKAA